jgi:hypothetical protein
LGRLSGDWWRANPPCLTRRVAPLSAFLLSPQQPDITSSWPITICAVCGCSFLILRSPAASCFFASHSFVVEAAEPTPSTLGRSCPRSVLLTLRSQEHDLNPPHLHYPPDCCGDAATAPSSLQSFVPPPPQLPTPTMRSSQLLAAVVALSSLSSAAWPDVFGDVQGLGSVQDIVYRRQDSEPHHPISSKTMSNSAIQTRNLRSLPPRNRRRPMLQSRQAIHLTATSRQRPVATMARRTRARAATAKGPPRPAAKEHPHPPTSATTSRLEVLP